MVRHRLERSGRSSGPVQRAAGPHECGWGIAVVASTHLIIALVDGLQRGLGVFFLTWRDEFEASEKETAAVSSANYSMLAFSCLLGGVITKRFGCRPTAIFGGLLATLSMFTTHWANGITHLCIAAGCCGIGMGILVNASLTGVAVHFDRQYQTAHAVAFSGSGVGTVALPPLYHLLQETYGWRGAMLIISAIGANMIMCAAILRPPTKQRDSQSEFVDGREDTDSDASGDRDLGRLDTSFENDGPTLDRLSVNNSLVENGGRCISVTVDTDERVSCGSSTTPKTRFGLLTSRLCTTLGLHLFAKSYRFGLLCLLQTEVGLPYFGYVVFLVPQAEAAGVAPSSAAFMVSLYGIGVLVGRLASGLLIGWKLSAEVVSALSLLVASFSLILINLEGYAVSACGAFIQGLAGGVFFALCFVLLRRYVGVEYFSVGFGLSYIFLGISSFFGPILTGVLFDATKSYQTVFHVLAGVYVFCALQVLMLPLLGRIEPGMDTE